MSSRDQKTSIAVENLKKVKEDKNTEGEKDINKRRNPRWSLCDHHNLPLWLQDNDYIETSHRPQLPSFSACFLSIFRMHSETINIWTHLLGCTAFIMIAAYFYLSKVYKAEEKIVFTPFFLGAVICLGFSFAFHMVRCHSQSVSMLFNRLDYCGIACLITGSFVPWLYYAFYCDFWLKIIYLTITINIGICTVIVSLFKKFGEPKCRPIRAAVYVVFGLSGIVPGIHYLYMEGFELFFKYVSSLLISSALYIIGAVIYAYRFPERVFPRKCDIWFQSHQIFHVLVVMATLLNYLGLTWVVEYRRNFYEYCMESKRINI